MRLKPLIVVVALLATGCTAEQASNPASVEPDQSLLQSVVIPAVAGDYGQPARPVLQWPADVYARVWSQALSNVPMFDGRVAVAVLAEGDPIGALCEDDLTTFEPTAKAAQYCRAAHDGPDPLPYAGIILLPAGPVMETFPDGLMDVGDLRSVQGMVMLLARTYVLHLLSELELRQSISPSVAASLHEHVDCLTGLTMRAYISAMSDQQWSAAAEYAGEFPVDGLLAPKYKEVIAGFNSGRMASCL